MYFHALLKPIAYFCFQRLVTLFEAAELRLFAGDGCGVVNAVEISPGPGLMFW